MTSPVTYRAIVAVSVLLMTAASARAERVQVYSIQGADCATCGEKIKGALKKAKGIKKTEFDMHKVELTVEMEDGVPDSVVLEAAEKVGLRAIVGAGQGAYLPKEPYPAGADMLELNKDGEAVGPLDKLRVADKFTVFDVYADWCGPCRDVDKKLREIVAKRPDVAVRKLSVVDFDSPLAQELGIEMLPHLVVFSPQGKRTEIQGAELGKIEKALKKK
jgi:thiol-disulfide isomerase/thioredoxin/copper chaperone CopZ